MTPVNNSYLQTSTSAEQASLTVLTPQQEVANAFAFKKYQTIHEARPFEVARFLESFQRADADSDGFVTQKELNDHVVRFGPQPGSGDISKIKLNEEFVLPARLMKENFATLASSAKGVSRSDLLNAAAKGGSKDRLDQGDGLKLLNAFAQNITQRTLSRSSLKRSIKPNKPICIQPFGIQARRIRRPTFETRSRNTSYVNSSPYRPMSRA